MQKSPYLNCFAEVLDESGRNFEGTMVCPTEAQSIVPRLLAYDDAIRPNFIPWMKQVAAKCVTPGAVEVCQENVHCEESEDHPGMLRRYVSQYTPMVIDRAGAGADFERLHMVVIDPLDCLWTAVRQHSLSGLIIMAALEHLSAVFIPEMRRWGEVLEFQDFQYVDVHGAADAAHAEAFRNAVASEADCLAPDFDLFRGCATSAIGQVTNLLKPLFC